MGRWVRRTIKQRRHSMRLTPRSGWKPPTSPPPRRSPIPPPSPPEEATSDTVVADTGEHQGLRTSTSTCPRHRQTLYPKSHLVGKSDGRGPQGSLIYRRRHRKKKTDPGPPADDSHTLDPDAIHLTYHLEAVTRHATSAARTTQNGKPSSATSPSSGTLSNSPRS